MARYSIVVGNLSTTGAAAKTLLQLIAAAQNRAKVCQVHVSCGSSTSTDGPARFRILRQTTAGTSGSTPTLNPYDAADGTAATTCGINYSAEPTAGVVLLDNQFAVQGGGIDLVFIPGCEIVIPLSGRLGFEITTPQNQTTVSLSVEIDE